VGGCKPSWYYWLKFSRLGKVYSHLRHPYLVVRAAIARQYYEQVLPPKAALVFDIGANVGDLSAVFIAMGHSVIACEPDPENVRQIKPRFAGNNNITILPLAIGKKTGTATLYMSGAHGRSLSTLSEKRKKLLDRHVNAAEPVRFDAAATVSTTTLDALIAEFGRPDFVKIDVEGAEFEVLKGLSQAVPLLSFEANLPDFYEETMAGLLHLQTIHPAPKFNCSTDDQNLVFPEFQSADYFLSWLPQQQAAYFEILCQMS
jgi:FkbM family methyltransferase